MISFEKDEKMTKDEVMSFLKSKGHLILTPAISSADILKYDNLIIDSKCRTVRRDSKSIDLTNYEFEILYLLAKRPGQVFSKEQIYSHVWKAPSHGAQENVVSLIRRIRKKIEPNPAKPVFILTEWGVGYKFNDMVGIKQAASVKETTELII